MGGRKSLSLLIAAWAIVLLIFVSVNVWLNGSWRGGVLPAGVLLLSAIAVWMIVRRDWGDDGPKSE